VARSFSAAARHLMRWEIELDSKEDNSAPSTALPSTMAPRVPELRIAIADALGWVSGLTDYETGWFFRLLFSSASADPQGYLQDSPNLWRVVGAHRPGYWESNKAGVLARFDRREVDGIRMLCFPPLLEIIHNGREKLQNYRARTHSLTGVDPRNQNQKQSECAKKPCAKKEGVKNAGDTRRSTPLDRLIGG
jgi:hypothetical protein